MGAEIGRPDIAKLLPNRPDVDIDALDMFLRTAAEIAAEQGHISTIRLLLVTAGTDSNSMSTPNSCVRAAAASGRLDVMRLLLHEYNACASKESMYGNTALHLAVRSGHVDMVRFLTRRSDVRVGVVSLSGMTALHYAARHTPKDSATPII